MLGSEEGDETPAGAASSQKIDRVTQLAIDARGIAEKPDAAAVENFAKLSGGEAIQTAVDGHAVTLSCGSEADQAARTRMTP